MGSTLILWIEVKKKLNRFQTVRRSGTGLCLGRRLAPFESDAFFPRRRRRAARPVRGHIHNRAGRGRDANGRYLRTPNTSQFWANHRRLVRQVLRAVVRPLPRDGPNLE